MFSKFSRRYTRTAKNGAKIQAVSVKRTVNHAAEHGHGRFHGTVLTSIREERFSWKEKSVHLCWLAVPCINGALTTARSCGRETQLKTRPDVTSYKDRLLIRRRHVCHRLFAALRRISGPSLILVACISPVEFNPERPILQTQFVQRAQKP